LWFCSARHSLTKTANTRVRGLLSGNNRLQDILAADDLDHLFIDFKGVDESAGKNLSISSGLTDRR
jgi:hypothetical protein